MTIFEFKITNRNKQGFKKKYHAVKQKKPFIYFRTKYKVSDFI